MTLVRTVFCTGIAGAILLAAAGAGAEPQAGDRELQFGGGFFLAQGDVWTGTAQGDVAYGLYLSERFEIGARQLFSYAINSPKEDVWTGSSTGYFNYYPWITEPNRRLRPFFGVLLGAAYSDVDITGTAGPVAGLKYYFRDDMYFVAQYRFEIYFDKLDAGEETTDFEDGNHVLTLGLGLRWGR